MSLYVLMILSYTGSATSLIDSFIATLSLRFSLKHLGNLSYFLGVEVLPHPQGIFLSQPKYVSDILQRANMTGCKPCSAPLSTSLQQLDGSPLPSLT